MKILCRVNGSGFLYDTENPDYCEKSDIKPDTKRSLHLSHRMTDYTFLRQFFPEKHRIFLQFSSSYFYDVTDDSATTH
jgi:hypothetical protein